VLQKFFVFMEKSLQLSRELMQIFLSYRHNVVFMSTRKLYEQREKNRPNV